MSGEIKIVDVVGSAYLGDAREPYGLCRWCGDDNSERQGHAIIEQNGERWYECASCALAIGDYELFDDDADEIRRISALIRIKLDDSEGDPDGAVA
jgi:hypothetical protein